VDVSQRIRQARVAAGLSARELASRVGVSAAAISKYELDKDFPRPSVLVRLARELNVKTEFFFREMAVDLYCPAFRCRAMSATAKASLEASLKDALERYLMVESLFGVGEPSTTALPSVGMIHSLDDVEDSAVGLRETWSLGLGPLGEMVPGLEDNGVKIVMFAGRDGFDGYSCIANGSVPVIACSADVPGDRQRFTLSHELAHLSMEVAQGIDEEVAAHRFAAAFLAPRQTILANVGSRRTDITIEELAILKREFGMSMQAILRRIHDLGIITEAAFARIYQRFIDEGWVRTEPGVQFPPETPRRFSLLVCRAIAERLLTPSTAAQLIEPRPTFRHPIETLNVSEMIANEYRLNRDLAAIAESGVGDWTESGVSQKDKAR